MQGANKWGGELVSSDQQTYEEQSQKIKKIKKMKDSFVSLHCLLQN